MILKTEIMRPAIAMLELIFAIVIMGIILMSAPMLISTAAKSGYVAIQQEGINEAASQVNMIMGYQWDENDVPEEYIDPILLAGGDPTLNENGTTGRRLGTPEESYRTFVRSDGQNLSATIIADLGFDGETVEDDIDDFDGTTTNLLLVPEATLETNYIETTTINIDTNISYMSDTITGGYNQASIDFDPFFTAAGSTTNIKSITATLTSSSTAVELDKKIILHAFTCNIGGYKLEEKDVN